MTGRLAITWTAFICSASLLQPALARAQSSPSDVVAPSPTRLRLAESEPIPGRRTAGPRRLAAIKSPIAKGAFIGLVAGIATGAVICTVGECHGDEGDGTFLSILFLGGIGAGAGAGIGALARPSIAHVPIYQSPGGAASIGVTQSIRKRGIGLAGSFTWR